MVGHEARGLVCVFEHPPEFQMRPAKAEINCGLFRLHHKDASRVPGRISLCRGEGGNHTSRGPVAREGVRFAFRSFSIR